MGSYEDEYRKYYLDTKTKLKIKSDKRSLKNKSDSLKKRTLNFDSFEDIYPKKKYNEKNVYSDEKIYTDENIYRDEEIYSDENIYTDKEIYSTKKESINTKTINKGGNSYRGIGTYRGIDSYNNNQNNYGGFDGYNGRAYYGNNLYNGLNIIKEEKSVLSKLGNRIIIELLLTLLLFASVIGIKSLPYKETRAIYTTFKGIVNTGFEYKDFMEYVKTIDVMKEINNIKENLNIDEYREIESGDINTFKLDKNDENVDDITSDNVQKDIN